MNKFTRFCATLGVSIGSVLMHGFVASKLYMWFILPIFALPNISWLAFAGIVLFVQMFSTTSIPSETTSLEDSIFMHIAMALVNLSIGHALHYFIYVV